MSDLNKPLVYDVCFQTWMYGLPADERHAIFGEVLERYYPDGFNGFVQDAEADAIKTEQHGI